MTAGGPAGAPTLEAGIERWRAAMLARPELTPDDVADLEDHVRSEAAGLQRAGLTEGDVITKVDGRTITKPEDVAAAIENKKPGDRVSIEVERAGQSTEFDVTLDERPTQTDTGR